MQYSPFLVYKASAGSGKTHALVKEYLKMVFAGVYAQGADERTLDKKLRDNFMSVLAITFTNKAAAEMKERILSELQAMASAPVDPQGKGMGPDVLKELKEMGEAALDGRALQRLAAQLYEIILHAYSDLSVSTIDSFTHRVVRTFAHDFGKPMNFEVMIEQQDMKEQAVARLMSLAGTEGQEELTEVLKVFAESQMENDASFKVETLIEGLASQLFEEDAGEHLRKLSGLSLTDFVAIHKGYEKARDAAETEFRQQAQSMLSTLEKAGLGVKECPFGMKGYYGYLVKAAEGKAGEPGKRVVDAFERGMLVSEKSGLKADADALFPTLSKDYKAMRRSMVRHATYKVLLKNLYSVALLGVLDKEMRGYANDHEIVHLSDFNRLINQVVEDEDNPAPFFYERLGSRYQHFLIDEFQDTSVMQWHNMVPLLENGVSQGRMSMVVGDGKQSIYRFRQGDVAQFVRLPKVEGMKHHGQVLSMPGNGRVKNLEENHRSSEAIVDFNNRFFSMLARNVYTDNPSVQDIYIGRDSQGNLNKEGEEELRQKKVKQAKGYVQVAYVSKAQAVEEGYDDVDEAICGRIVQTVRKLVDENGYKYKDIVVLTRGNAQLAKIGTYLLTHGEIPQTSKESFYLSESHAVMAVVAVLRLLHDRTDRQAAAELRHRLYYLGLVTEEALAAGNDAWAANEDRTTMALGTAALNLDYLGSLDLYGSCEEAVRLLNLDGIDTAYVASLLNKAAAFASRHQGGLNEFLDWFDSQNMKSNNKPSAASSDDLDAVQLMTIHKAKGLGKPVVICPLEYGVTHPSTLWIDLGGELAGQSAAGPSEDAATPLLPTSYVSLSKDESTLFDRQKEEERIMKEVDELNALYVAFTRPKDRLYVFSPDHADLKSPDNHDRRFPALLHYFSKDGYQAGNENEPREGHKGSDGTKKAVAVKQIAFADWTKKVAVASPASEKKLLRLADDKKRFGTYAHDLLARVKKADDVEEAVRVFADEMQLDPPEKEALGALARQVVRHPDTARFFAEGCVVRNECNLVAHGTLLRPDRVVLSGGQTWVVDFKTGVPLPAHAGQVADYCRAVREMGCERVSGYLIYLLPEVKVEEVAC